VSLLTDDQIARIAARLAERMGGPPARAGQARSETRTTAPGAGRTTTAAAEPAGGSRVEMGEGVFDSIDGAVQAARGAFVALGKETLVKRNGIIAAIREAMLPAAEELSRMAWEETGLGRVEDKIVKNRLVTTKTPGTEALHPEAVSGDHGLTLFERAPYGVIGAITPVTNPTSTIICNSIGMIAAGNAVVFNAHPSARACSGHTIRLLNRAIRSAGGPPNLIATVAAPTIETAKELMRHPGVRLLAVTGGAAVVEEAMHSGKRAICAGPGNPPSVVDETADIERAARDIVRGASLDNNIICTDEKEVFVVRSVADALLEAMTRHGAYRLSPSELRRVEQVIFKANHGPGKPAVINKELIGKNAARILDAAGITVDPQTRLAVCDVSADHPLVWTEQMMPVLPVVRVENADQAIDLAIRAEKGCGHSAAMHSRNLDNLSRMAREINTTIFVKNGPCCAGLGAGGEGHASFTIASPTGEGMTGPMSFTRERRCVVVDHFRIV
jgi:acyl-CoA reductase-like NAD-dependent aldehyde dehydrogenase